MEKEILKFILSNQGAVNTEELVTNLGDASTLSEILYKNEKLVSCEFYRQPKVVARTIVSLCRPKDCEGCGRLHLCKNVLYTGSCHFTQSRRGCTFSHDLHSDHNLKILKELELETLSRTELCILLLQSDNTLLPSVRADSVFLMDDTNRGVLPGQGGVFDTLELQVSSHYEVQGESTADSGEGSSQTPARFSFRRPFSVAPCASATQPQSGPRASGIKMLQRNIFIAELVEGKLETQKTVTVKFSEFESSVASIKAKVVEALGQEEAIVLVDSHHSEIIDSEGTRGPAFWKQHARKIYAVPEEQSKRRESRQQDTALPVVLDQIEEVVLASQGLQEVSKTLKDLVKFAQANQHTVICLTDSQAAVKAAFVCIICGDPMREPMFAGCCRSLLGCQPCLVQWQENHSYCPKCRTVDFNYNVQLVVGLDDALVALRNIISISFPTLFYSDIIKNSFHHGHFRVSNCSIHACVWTVRESQSTRREPMVTRGEHADSSQKERSWPRIFESAGV